MTPVWRLAAPTAKPWRRACLSLISGCLIRSLRVKLKKSD